MDQTTGEVFGLMIIDGGGAAEMFDAELKAVLDNCQDVNTEAKAARKVVLTLTITPNERRNSAELKYTVKSHLPGIQVAEIPLFLGRNKDGSGYASQFNPPGQVTVQEQIDAAKAAAEAEDNQDIPRIGGEVTNG